MAEKPHIGLIAGEQSGDRLGADLMQALRQLLPEVRFSGLGGPLMHAQGLDMQGDYRHISVMGFVEPLLHLPRILRLRRHLAAHFQASAPDLVVGIDSPSFCTGLCRILKDGGLRTAQYVSPSVWAWRPGRIKAMSRAFDMVLCLFPFEVQCYEGSGLEAHHVGHPLADSLRPMPAQQARAQLGLASGPTLTLMPGSRVGEVRRLAGPLAHAAMQMERRMAAMQVVVALAHPGLRSHLPDALPRHWTILDGNARCAMSAADLVLMASGTATLEAALLERPMVAVYRLDWPTYLIARPLVRIPFVALPNLLAGRQLVPELLQGDASAGRIAAQALPMMESAKHRGEVRAQLRNLRASLGQGASRKAAALLADMLR